MCPCMCMCACACAWACPLLRSAPHLEPRQQEEAPRGAPVQGADLLVGHGGAEVDAGRALGVAHGVDGDAGARAVAVEEGEAHALGGWGVG